MTYGLFTGINLYSPAYYGEGNDLTQCVKDAERLRSMIGFLAQPINQFLVDEKATATNWLLEVLKLAETTRKGDVVVLTQSSHGTTYHDQNGVASGLCFYDRIMWDHEVNKALRTFKAGVVVIRITDTCYAQSTYRLPIPPNGDFMFTHRSIPCPEHVKPSRTRRLTKFGQPTKADNRMLKCMLIDYAACLFDQQAYEDMNGGVFTNAILSRLSQPVSYIDLFKELPKLPYPQNPTFESVRAKRVIDKPFLSGI